MTEQQWLTSTDSLVMVGRLRLGDLPGTHSIARRLCLFAVACLRSVLPEAELLRQEPQLRAVEDFTDGELPWVAATAVIQAALQEAASVPGRWRTGDVVAAAIIGRQGAGIPSPSEAARNAIEYAWTCSWTAGISAADLARSMADLLRDIFGNPFHPTPWSGCPRCAGQGWRTQSDHDNPDSQVRLPCRQCGPSAQTRQLAQTAYDHRQADGSLDPVSLAAAADALEEAGYPATVPCPLCAGTGRQEDDGDGDGWICDSTVPSVLAHLRSPGRHYRGMWSLDLILGRE